MLALPVPTLLGRLTVARIFHERKAQQRIILRATLQHARVTNILDIFDVFAIVAVLELDVVARLPAKSASI
jgi:hypothetical protein